MYFVFGVKVTEEDGKQRLVPLTSEMFSPDISVLNQQILRTIYPDAGYDFLASLVQNRAISELKMFPILYVGNSEISTEIDPLLDFLVDSKQATNLKYKPSSPLFGDVIKDEIDKIMLKGTDAIVKSKISLSPKVIKRSIKLGAKDSTKIIIAEVGLKLFMNQEMYVSLFPSEDPNELLLDIIMQKSIYFKTTDLSKLKIGYKLKIVELDISDNSWNTLVSFKPVMLPIELKRNVIKTLQVPYKVFIGNVFDAGISLVGPEYQKKVLVNTKNIKLKNS